MLHIIFDKALMYKMMPFLIMTLKNDGCYINKM